MVVLRTQRLAGHVRQPSSGLQHARWDHTHQQVIRAGTAALDGERDGLRCLTFHCLTLISSIVARFASGDAIITPSHCLTDICGNFGSSESSRSILSPKTANLMQSMRT
jgi:hypothetical protein